MGRRGAQAKEEGVVREVGRMMEDEEGSHERRKWAGDSSRYDESVQWGIRGLIRALRPRLQG